MERLRFPYVVEVYQYEQERDEYSMEYCDETLRAYIAKQNGSLGFRARKRIALQFLYGLNYLHANGLLHRDISPQNVLLKVYHDGAVLVKLSDFGLFTGKQSLNVVAGDVRAIIQKCTSADILARYKSVMELISDVDLLDVDLLEVVASETTPNP